MDTNIVVLDNVRTNYVTPFSFVDEGKKIGEGFVLPLTKYEQQGETEERERDAGMPEIVAPPPAATQTILSMTSGFSFSQRGTKYWSSQRTSSSQGI